MMKLFLSYASEYKDLADEVALAVIGVGHEVVFDQTLLRPGDDYNRKLRDVFNDVEGVIFLIAPESVQAGAYTLTELSLARQKWPHPAGHVLPVIVAPTSLELIPAYLKAVTFLHPKGNVPAEIANAAVQLWSTATQNGVRVQVHTAAFKGRPHVPAYFINVTNLFKTHDVEITHVWFESTPRVNVVQPDRVLPVRLRPLESWETWQYVYTLPATIMDNAFELARVRLSDGTVIKSTKNVDVPQEGSVPGGPVTKP